MEAFLRGLLSLSIGGSLIAGLLLLLRSGTRNKLPKSFYYYAWLLVLLRLALPIPGQLNLDLPQPNTPVAEFVSLPQAEQPADFPALTDWEIDEAPAPERITATPQFHPAPEQTPAEPEKHQWSLADLSLASLLGVIWAVGFVWCLSRDLVDYFFFRHEIRRATIPARSSDYEIYRRLVGPHHPQLCRCTAVDTPMLMGILHPTLLLPDRRYSPEILECVFRHELIHYSRRDILYKWFAVPVLAMHWFNPLTVFIRRDIDRCCELSCDERLLKEMDHDQRKSYGETLLVLAARSAPARTTLSTSFATEKKNLKERLVHIMNFSPKSKWTILTAVILLVAVALCAIVFGPQADPVELPEETIAVTEAAAAPVAEAPTEAAELNAEPEEGPAETTAPGEATAVVVRTVDEFLAAIGSNTEITLEPGVYDLTTASDYGDIRPKENPYQWEETFDGFQLNIKYVENMTITGADKEGCEIVTAPRYAAVMSFEGCSNIKVSTITAGHTEGPGRCVGAVIQFMGSANVTVDNAKLYGCGTYGVEGYSSNVVDVVNCDIYDCSLGATRFTECKNVRINKCNIFDCGLGEWPAYELFYFAESRNCAVTNCEITSSNANALLMTTSCKDIYFISNQVSGCKFGETVIDYSGASPIVDASSFQGTGSTSMISAVPAGGTRFDRADGTVVNLDGKELKEAQLKSMTYKAIDFTMPVYEGATPTMPDDAPVFVGKDIQTDLEVVKVKTVDEFLAAIKPNTMVQLAAGTYDLSTASDYGTGWTDYYRWVEVHDGYELEIMNVSNFHIRGLGKQSLGSTVHTIISARPRYAEVLKFKDCKNISVFELTAGHTVEPGACSGGVLYFENCDKAVMDKCGLYGCGIYGITAVNSSDFIVYQTEIYDCSYGAVDLDNCTNFSFEECDIHDCPMPYFGGLRRCYNVTVDGELISEP